MTRIPEPLMLLDVLVGPFLGTRTGGFEPFELGVCFDHPSPYLEPTSRARSA